MSYSHLYLKRQFRFSKNYYRVFHTLLICLNLHNFNKYKDTADSNETETLTEMENP